MKRWRGAVRPGWARAQIAILAVSLESREGRARTGGAGRERAGGYIDMTRAIRSPGSALKPFLYAIAFDEGIAAPETLVRDAPRRFGGYLPENFDRRFHGDVSLEDALRHSLNLPAVATLEQIGAGRFHAALTRAGAEVRLPRRAVAEPGSRSRSAKWSMTLEDLVQLYAALGDDGAPAPARRQRCRDLFARRFVRAETAERCWKFWRHLHPAGRAPHLLARDAPMVAFKTGTSCGFRDAWAIGVWNGYAIGVWVGRPDGSRPAASGRTEALPICSRLSTSSAAHLQRLREERKPRAGGALETQSAKASPSSSAGGRRSARARLRR